MTISTKEENEGSRLFLNEVKLEFLSDRDNLGATMALGKGKGIYKFIYR